MKNLHDYITEYYDNVELKTFDKAQVDSVVNTCLCRYNTTIAGDFQPEPEARFKTELDYINYKLTSCNLLYVLKIGAIQAFTFNPTKLIQDVFCEYADKLEEGYAPVSTLERSYNKYERGYKGFILCKTQEQQQVEIELIIAEAEKLLLRKIEIENEELLDINEATAYAKQELAKQEQEQEFAYIQRALKAAATAKSKILGQIKTDNNPELEQLLKKDFLFFADIKAVVNGTNSELESILTNNNYVSVRKYIGSGKQANLWIKDELADSYDYKAITPAA